jgi:GT2 family glycosyltransferase
MDVSIIVVNFNTFAITCKCIASVYQYTTNIEKEVILVDNASVECAADEFKKVFPEIKLVKSPINVGFARGNNLGLKQAEGKYILLLNSDTALLNNCISISFKFLEQNPRVAVATGKLLYPDGKVQHNCQRFPSVKYQLIELLRLQKIFSPLRRKLYGSFFDYNTVAFPDWVWGTFFMFRKELLKQLPANKLADDFFMYGEDMQWCKEFKNFGLKSVFLPDARIEHLMGASGAAKIEMMKTNEEFFLKKYYNWPNRALIRILRRALTIGNGEL